MDLLKSYDSESDDEFDVKTKASSNSVLCQNIDNDFDIDFDVESVSEGKKETMRERKCNLDLHKAVESIDFKTSVSAKQFSQLETNSDYGKEVDYFHLEDSESDDEVENDEINIARVTESAFILRGKTSGPQKPEVTVNPDNQIQTYLTKPESVSCEILRNYIEFGNSPSHNYENVSFTSESHTLSDSSDKKFKPSLETNKQNDVSSNYDIKCIFRNEPRVPDVSNINIVCHLPRQIINSQEAHASIISSLCWCVPQYSFLYLSAAKDGLLKIWDMYCKNPVHCFKTNFALNAAKWSVDGKKIFAGGIEKKAFVYDVQTGRKIIEYDLEHIIYSLEVHPYMEEAFLVGVKNEILAFDLRANTTLPIRTFSSKCEEILDIAFLDENQFVCSTNIVTRDSADRTIMAWDFNSGALLSNQIYLERFTCPSLKVHPFDSCFIAQTNGNYIAAFSSIRPYKRKNKRYMGHKVSGYGIEVDISPDGKYVVSGDAEGHVHFYNYFNTDSIRVTPKQNVPINRVKWHPCFPSILITSTYDGRINLWK